MDVFITGGTGLIGSAVVAELTAHGHRVAALARSARSADVARRAGARVVRGDLAALDVIRAGAEAADGTIHLAFSNDFEHLEAGIAEETAALETMGRALIGSGRPLVTVSGTAIVPGVVSTERDLPPVDGPVAGRGRAVLATLALAQQGVRASAVRMPRTVHDHGRGGFAGILTQLARDAGTVGFPEDGEQRWPAVHAADAASLFRIALERAPGGTMWNAVQDEGDRVRDIAAVIGRRLGLPVEPRPAASYGTLGQIFALDQPASSAITRSELGWEPVHPTLLEDLEQLEP